MAAIDTTPRAPAATPPIIVLFVSAGSATIGIGVGSDDGYGIIMKRGDEDGEPDPLDGHGVSITNGVEVGVSIAV